MSNINDRFVIRYVIRSKNAEFYLIDDDSFAKFVSDIEDKKIMFFYSKAMALTTIEKCETKCKTKGLFSIKRVKI